MASGSNGGADVQPPALPVKQRRSRSSRGSCQDEECVPLSPGILQQQSDSDVFPESSDCHAAQCPIHQRPPHHQMRFFSDGTPPPVPRKRLARAVSLPTGAATPPPSFPYLQTATQNYDNPLYMLAPCAQEASEVGTSPAPFAALSQLSFHTPDEHLLSLFASFDNQGVVSQRIQHRHLLFLRCAAQRAEASVLLPEGAANGRDAGSLRPEDFLLEDGCRPQHIADTVYYSLHSTKFARQVLGLRVHHSTDTLPPVDARGRPPHVNVLDVIVHFQPCGTQTDKSTTEQLQGTSRLPCAADESPQGGSTEAGPTTVLALLQRGSWVSVERDVPRATLEDFLQENVEPLLHHRQLCVLLLQILSGSEHLQRYGAGAELKPQDVLLVWPVAQRARTDEGEGARTKTGVQVLWRTLGSPRVVLTPQPAGFLAPQAPTIRAQIGALIQLCLRHKDLNPIPTPYARVLLHLASVFQGEVGGLQMADATAMLQVLLWGPGASMLGLGSTAAAVHNWLTVKRALFVMKMAEQSLVQDQPRLDWDDCLCLQFLSLTDSATVVAAMNRLRVPLNDG